MFDADGRAVGIVVRDANGVRVYAIDRALERVRALIAERRAIPSATGLSLQKIEPALEAFFGASGVIASDVVPGSPAAAAGLSPGDVLRQIAGYDVADADAALRQLTGSPQGQPVALTIGRRGKLRQVIVVPDSLPAAPWIDAAGNRTGPATARAARDVFVPDLLGRTHIPADAAIVTIGGRRPERVGHVTRPLLVYVDDHGTRYFAVVAPRP